ncbi:helix-turn-helix domain-containing protein, partial [Paracoccus siganidrum]
RYYMETRLARARNLLMQTEMSVIEVALASGFSSPSHFSKCYRMHYGCTPYRQRGTGLGPQGPQGNRAGPVLLTPEGPEWPLAFRQVA